MKSFITTTLTLAATVAALAGPAAAAGWFNLTVADYLTAPPLAQEGMVMGAMNSWNQHLRCSYLSATMVGATLTSTGAARPFADTTQIGDAVLKIIIHVFGCTSREPVALKPDA